MDTFSKAMDSVSKTLDNAAGNVRQNFNNIGNNFGNIFKGDNGSLPSLRKILKNFGRGGTEEWLQEFRRVCRLDALQFADVWKQYDADGNGYIEGSEIDSFFNDLLDMGAQQSEGESFTAEERARLKEQFMNEFDENRDGKIEMAELAKLLPSEDNFLILFRTDNENITSKVFMETWRRFSTNGRNYIEASEVRNFLHELFRNVGKDVPYTKMDEYSEAIVRLYDMNNDGRLSFKELSRLLPEHENVLLRFKDEMNLSSGNFEQLFSHYDRDGNGSIAGDELTIFLKDVATVISDDIANNPAEFDRFRRMMLDTCDRSGDGSLQKEEIALWLGVDE